MISLMHMIVAGYDRQFKKGWPRAYPAPPTMPTEPIRIELQRRQTTIVVTWPANAADACATWLREIRKRSIDYVRGVRVIADAVMVP